MRIVAALVVTAVVAGAAIADRRASAATMAAAGAAEVQLLPLLDELDAAWTEAREDGPGPALRRLVADGERPEAAQIAAWDAGHAALQLRLVGLDLPLPALGAQRQAVLAVTLSRDAVAVMGRSARARDATVRDALAAEAVLLRRRGEQVAASSLASIEELRSTRRRIAQPPVLPEPVPASDRR